jgi:pyruvate kinase
LKAAARLGADYVALSFVRSRDDILAVNRWMKKNRAHIPVIAKIEKPRAVKSLLSILPIVEGVMVARGDLGIEMGLEKVPRVQKTIIGEAARFQIPAITATQMLETMIQNSHPTRAEVSDIANAVFDGTDAVMLSGETSIGKYPIDAVRTMRNIIEEAEENGAALAVARGKGSDDMASQLPAIAHAALNAAREAQARAIIIFTYTGRIARHLSKLKPSCLMLAAADSKTTLARLNLLRGVKPVFVEKSNDPLEMFRRTDAEIVRAGILKKGDTVILISGPWAFPGSLFMLAIHRIGERPS